MRAVDHYLEAEQRIQASDYQRQQGELPEAMHEAALAQVHARIALAGATAMQAYSTAQDAELDDWAEAAAGAGDAEIR